MVDANKDLLDLAKKQKELQAKDDDGGPKTINNNLILTSAELLKMIKNDKDQ
jgi:hypothetical protein